MPTRLSAAFTFLNFNEQMIASIFLFFSLSGYVDKA
jgi:hypothetical protein